MLWSISFLDKKSMSGYSPVCLSIVGYAACSSLLLIINKLSVHHFPAPSLILFLQLMSSAIIVKILGILGMIEVDELEWRKAKGFFFVSMAFLATLFANMKTLQYCNIETFIVFRVSTPLLVSVGDYVFLGREMPSRKSWFALTIILFFAGAYAYTDQSFHVTGYMWVSLWYFIFCFDQLYIKYIVDNVKMKSNWGRVYYTNLMASIPVGISAALNGEFRHLLIYDWSSEAMLFVSLSCVVGCAISYCAFLCRSLVSATMFTVIGNVCKVITVLINVIIWDQHASHFGIGCLFCCLFASYNYSQAPKRIKQKHTERI